MSERWTFEAGDWGYRIYFDGQLHDLGLSEINGPTPARTLDNMRFARETCETRNAEGFIPHRLRWAYTARRSPPGAL